MIDGILFDKDGTLLEYHFTMHHIYTGFFADLKDRYFVPELLMKKMKEKLGYSSDKLNSDSLIQFATNPQLADVLIESSEEYSVNYQWQLDYGKIELLELIEENSLREDVPYSTLPGVDKMLSYLKNNNYKLGIATADNHMATITSLKETDILHYFDYIGTSDNEIEPKPETFLADKFCSQCDIDPNELLIVGDSETDMVFAENVGAHFIGIKTNYKDNSTFKEKGYKSISNVNEIINIHNL